jgi:DNA-binding CsgD family transcriptional regulator
MDTALEFVLEIYRAAQDTSAEEFETLTLKLLQHWIPFRSAAWCSNAGIESGTYIVRGLQSFNEPDTIGDDLPALNAKYSAQMEPVAARPGSAVRRYTPALYDAKRAGDIQDYIRRYGHEHNLIVADIASPDGCGEWLSLFRPASMGPFEQEHERVLTLLMPHLVEALTINRKLMLGKDGIDPSAPGGTRALVKPNGEILHSGSRFCDLLRSDWTDWRYTRLPSRLLEALKQRGKAVTCDGSVVVTAKRFGDLMFLSANRVSSLARLSDRERVVIRLYASGKSHKEIAQSLDLAPTTIRNFIQHAYQKLGVSNKASLVHLLQSDK